MAIQLKILFTSTGLTKTMRFTQTMSVSETLRDIKDKTNEGGRDHGTPPSLPFLFQAIAFVLCALVSPHPAYQYLLVVSTGLFQPPDEKIGRFGRWLKPDKTLLFYDIQSRRTPPPLCTKIYSYSFLT